MYLLPRMHEKRLKNLQGICCCFLIRELVANVFIATNARKRLKNLQGIYCFFLIRELVVNVIIATNTRKKVEESARY
mgnify:CR=1 FL=1